MSSKVVFSEPAFIALSSHGRRLRGARRFPCGMEIQPTQNMKEEDKTMKAQKLSIPHHEETLKKDPNLQFNKLQQSEGDLLIQESRLFGDFVAREAILDEEYWTAAWLRAESHWEDRPNERHADNYKRKYADQEYNALNRRCKGYHGQTCTCIVAVKKEDKNVKRTIIKSVVGTLDLSIRYLLQGESFPGERVKAPLFCCPERKESSSRYGYVANLCVAKSARRRGIAVNMLEFAIQSAKSKGVDQIFVHVHRHNTPAQKLYQKLGFQIVELASSQLLEEQMYLLRIRT